ncbi:MAG: hypothetical protein IJG37_00310 [Synergistaceae bacterium]|nr:hypothetical protein [Synergistaceae bacterium]
MQEGGGQYEYISYLDDDDEWLPEKLEKQLAKLQECGNDTALVYCDCNIIYQDGAVLRKSYTRRPINEGYYAELLRGSFIPVNVLLRTECFYEEGGFDERLRALEDWEAWLRLARKYNFSYVDEPLLNIYRHYACCGEWKNFMKLWATAVSLQPTKIFGNIAILLSGISANLKKFLLTVFPNFYDRLARIKHELKGEK